MVVVEVGRVFAIVMLAALAGVLLGVALAWIGCAVVGLCIAWQLATKTAW